MSSKLPVIYSNANYEIEETLSFLLKENTSNPDLKQIEQCKDVLPVEFRRRGISLFLLEAKPQDLHIDLQKSGASFAYFLESEFDIEKVTGKLNALFCSIACKDFDTAIRITKNANSTWEKSFEYEDDFFYFNFIKALLLKAKKEEVEAILKNFKNAVNDPEDDLRFSICTALFKQQEEAFEQALGGLIEELKKKYEEAPDDDRVLEEEWATEGAIFIEGLALIRLAEMQSIPTQSNYLFIPDLAIQTQAPSFDPDSWKQA